MKCLSNATDYETTIKLAEQIEICIYDKPVIFHCYWNGELNEKHLISIRSCYFYNVLQNKKNKIILWLENNLTNDYNKKIEKYADIRVFSLQNELIRTFLENKSFYYNKPCRPNPL